VEQLEARMGRSFSPLKRGRKPGGGSVAATETPELFDN